MVIDSRLGRRAEGHSKADRKSASGLGRLKCVAIAVLIGVGIAVLGPILVSYISADVESRAANGTTWAGFAAAGASTSALILLYVSIQMQQKELRLQFKEFRKQTESAAKQVAAIENQNLLLQTQNEVSSRREDVSFVLSTSQAIKDGRLKREWRLTSKHKSVLRILGGRMISSPGDAEELLLLFWEAVGFIGEGGVLAPFDKARITRDIVQTWLACPNVEQLGPKLVKLLKKNDHPIDHGRLARVASKSPESGDLRTRESACQYLGDPSYAQDAVITGLVRQEGNLTGGTSGDATDLLWIGIGESLRESFWLVARFHKRPPERFSRFVDWGGEFAEGIVANQSKEGM